MSKIAYNACFGGFSLSRAAVLRAREISGDPKWGGAVLPGEYYSDGSGPAKDWMDSIHLDHRFPRTDPTLIRVIETMGKKANGACADLQIRELPSGSRYRITEYDGAEEVETPEEIEWSIAP